MKARKVRMGSKGKRSSSDVKVDLVPIKTDEKPSVDEEVKQAKYSEVADKTVIKEAKKKFPEALRALRALYNAEIAPKCLTGIDDNDVVSISCTLLRLPPTKTNPPRKIKKRICSELPHSFTDVDKQSVCLIVPDRIDIEERLAVNDDAERRFAHEIDRASKLWKYELETHGVTSIKDVFTATQLKRELPRHEIRGKFVKAYDVIMIERSIHQSILRLLHAQLKQHRVIPQMVNLAHAKHYAREIKRALKRTALRIGAHASRVTCKIGRLSVLDDTKLRANAAVVIKQVVENVYGGAVNIRTLGLSHRSLPMIPLYESEVNPNTLTDRILMRRSKNLYPLLDARSAKDVIVAQSGENKETTELSLGATVKGAIAPGRFLDEESYYRRVEKRKEERRAFKAAKGKSDTNQVRRVKKRGVQEGGVQKKVQTRKAE